MWAPHFSPDKRTTQQRSMSILDAGRKQKDRVALCAVLVMACAMVGLVACSNENLTAISVVQKHLEALKNNDYDAWISTMTEDKQQGFSKERNGDLGVISLTVNDIHNEEDESYKTSILQSEKAQEMGVTKENLAVVFARFTVEYDGTKVPSNSGEIEWHYILIRKDKNSPWLIQEWGYGKGGV